LELVKSLLAEAEQAHPCECCGILLGTGNAITAILPAANVHARPETHFEIDPQALIDAHRAARDGGRKVAGYYHSHPITAPEPSVTDQASAAGDGAVWAIIGRGKVTLWRDDPAGFTPLSYSETES